MCKTHSETALHCTSSNVFFLCCAVGAAGVWSLLDHYVEDEDTELSLLCKYPILKERVFEKQYFTSVFRTVECLVWME